MRKLIYAALTVLAIVTSVVVVCNTATNVDEVQTEEVLPKTNAERFPERYVGVEAGCAQIYDESYYAYLVSLEGKYPYEADLFDVESAKSCIGKYAWPGEVCHIEYLLSVRESYSGKG